MDSSSATKRCAAHSRRSCEGATMPCENCSRATKGWLGGCFTATAIMEVSGLALVAASGGLVGPRLTSTITAALIALPVLLILTCLLTGIPAVMTIWLSERFRIRSWLFFGCAGGAIGALSQTLLFRSFASVSWFFVLVGFFAGLDYWFVAGRYTGHDRALADKTASLRPTSPPPHSETSLPASATRQV